MTTEPAWLAGFRACAWRTVSLDAAEMTALRALVAATHPDDAIVVSCQRLEAYGFSTCACDAPVRAEGVAALRRLAGVAAGLDSVVLGEAQILGQVRAAFQDARGPLRRAADIALAAARELRRSALPGRSHAGHLLDRALTLAGRPSNGRLLVLGAGAMGRLIAERGARLGFEVTVAARRCPAWLEPVRFLPLGRTREGGRFGLIVGCLGSGAGQIPLDALPPAELVVDLGTPRNFAAPPGANVITLADLFEDEARRPHAAALRARLREELAALLDRRLARDDSTGRTAAPRLRSAIETVRRTEVDRARRLHPEADPAVLDATTRALVNRLFHHLTAALDGADPDLAAWVTAQFEAATGPGRPGPSRH